MRKAYRSDDDIQHALTTAPAEGMIYDRTRNGNYEILHCGYYNGLLLGHREEKYQHSKGGYNKEVVDRFEKIILNINGVGRIINKYIENKESKKLFWQKERRTEIEKKAPQRTNLMIGRTEIPKWSGQNYEVWKRWRDGLSMISHQM